MNRHAWDGMAQELVGAGFHVLTFDSGGSQSLLNYIAGAPALSVFAAAAHEDSDGVAVADAAYASKNPQPTLKLYQGGAHGVAMFERQPELKPLIVKWLQETLTMS